MVNITKVGDHTNSASIREFIVDTVAEINKLPCIETRGTLDNETLNDCVAAGSSALVLENSSVWMLSPSDQWVNL